MGSVHAKLCRAPPERLADEATAEEKRGFLVRWAQFAAVNFALRKAARYGVLEQLASFRALSPGRKRVFELYVLSTVNAGACCGLGFAKLRRGGVGALVSSGGVAETCNWLCGYFLCDLLSSWRSWAERPADVLHHTLGMGVLWTVLVRPIAYPLVPPFAMVEFSTLFLNAAYMLRELGGSARVERACKLAFAASFALLRCAWMPYLTFVVLAKNHPKVWKAMGPGRHGLVGVGGLQFYWMWKIVALLVGGASSSS